MLKDSSLLGCDAVLLGKLVPKFWWIVVPSFSGVKQSNKNDGRLAIILGTSRPNGLDPHHRTTFINYDQDKQSSHRFEVKRK